MLLCLCGLCFVAVYAGDGKLKVTEAGVRWGAREGEEGNKIREKKSRKRGREFVERSWLLLPSFLPYRD